MLSTETLARAGLIAVVSAVIGLNTLRPLLKRADWPASLPGVASLHPNDRSTTTPLASPAIAVRELDAVPPPTNISPPDLTIDEPVRGALPSEPPLRHDISVPAAYQDAAQPPSSETNYPRNAEKTLRAKRAVDIGTIKRTPGPMAPLTYDGSLAPR